MLESSARQRQLVWAAAGWWEPHHHVPDLRGLRPWRGLPRAPTLCSYHHTTSMVQWEGGQKRHGSR
jgi:hypothetical protein